MNGTNFEAVVEEFRQYIIAQNVAHLNHVHDLEEKMNEKKGEEFRESYDYIHKTYPWYFKMTEMYRRKKYVVDETLEEMFLRIATDDANKSIENFMTKVEEKAGSIEGAKELYICNGDINGIVVGSDADVKVTTFGAGGYNIQRFHFRTKVTALKQRA